MSFFLGRKVIEVLVPRSAFQTLMAGEPLETLVDFDPVVRLPVVLRLTFAEDVALPDQTIPDRIGPVDLGGGDDG